MELLLRPQEPLRCKYTNSSGADRFVCLQLLPVNSNRTKVIMLADSLGDLRLLNGYPPEVMDEKLEFDLDLSLIHGIGISLIETRSLSSVEVAYVTVTGIDILYTLSSRRQKIGITIASAQVDAQIQDSNYPAAIFLTPQRSLPVRPLLTASYVVRRGQIGDGFSMDTTEYASLLLMPITIKLDGNFLLSLYSFGKSLKFVETTADEKEQTPGEMTYFALLEVHPMRFGITLNQLGPLLDRFGPIFRGIGVTLGNFNDLQFTLSALLLTDVHSTNEELVHNLVQIYENRSLLFLKRYGILSSVGSLELLGDPVGQLRNLAGGVKDLVYVDMCLVGRFMS